MSSQIHEYMYRKLKDTQRTLGLARLEMGTLLEVFKNNEALWRGRSDSFHSFLEEERIQPDGAKQFMRVAKKYVLDLGLSDDILAELACVNFRILDMASKMITPENQEEIIGLLVALGERDARAALNEMNAPGKESKFTNDVPDDVRALMRKFRAMPDDYRIAFLAECATKKPSKAICNA